MPSEQGQSVENEKDCAECGGAYDVWLGFTLHANNCSAYNALIAPTRATLSNQMDGDKALNQWRRPGCAGWYDGSPGPSDGPGPHETRTVYTAPDKALMPEAADPLGMAELDLEALRQREVQMIGAALSRRHWYEVEDAYNQLRDKIDRELGRRIRIARATPTPIEEPANAATVYETDDRDLFCKHCGRSALRHHPVKGGGLHCSPAAATNAGQVEAHGHDWWLSVAKLAGKHGVRYQTNSRLEDFLVEIAALTNGQATGESK